jgi:formate hydrogenlyase subunit 3/multisubunit Na+/H+ antiporter MnhD subunit
MNMVYPSVMIALPLVAALPALVFRRTRHIPPIVGLVSLVILWGSLWAAPPGPRLFPENLAVLLGQGLNLTPLVRILFLFIYPALGLVFGYHWLRPTNPSLVPAGLAMLSSSAASLMISNKTLGAIWIVAAAALLIPPLYNGRYPAVPAVWRFFLMVSIAALPVMIAAWFVIVGQPNQPVARIGFMVAALILSGGFPFYIWAAGLARHASLPALALAFGILAPIFIFFLLFQLDDAPAIRSALEFRTALLWSAAATTVLAAFMMTRANSPRELFVYAIVLDMGFMLPVLVMPGVAGNEIALLGSIGRYVGLILVLMGLSIAHEDDRSEPGNEFSGRPNQIRTLLMYFGLLTLLGLPMTPGFAGRWAQLAAIPAISPPGIIPVIPVMMAAAMAIGTFAIFRQFIQKPTDRYLPFLITEKNRVVRYFTFGILSISVLLGLFPQLLTRSVSTLISSF